MKNKFIFVATLIFTVMLAMTAFAADTWKQTEDGKWYCMDKDGNPYYGVAKKSGNSYYYLDDATGEMVVNKIVEIGDAKYWFGADGAKAVDQWVQVPVDTNVDENGYKWMYFSPVSGKAAIGGEGKFVTINGKKYAFDTNGYMLYGYLTDKLDKADSVLDATYYLGGKDEGVQFTGWQKFENGALGEFSPEYENKELVYFYFKNGKKLTGEQKVEGVKYYFNEDGALYTGYQVSTGSYVATGSYYLGKNDDGSMKKNQWVKTAAWSKDGETQYWYYLGSDGKAFNSDGTKPLMKKIGDKVYMFDETGKMMTGRVFLRFENYQGLNNPAAEENYVVIDKIENAETDKLYYFSTDADNDGSMKTGSQVVVIDDEEKTLMFDKHGVAYEGVVKDYVYNNGILQKGVGVVKCNKDGNSYLVNASGKILKKTTIKDEDGQLWAVQEDKVTIARFADQDYAGKAAKEWASGKTEFTVNKKTYEIIVTDGYAKYFEVK